MGNAVDVLGSDPDRLADGLLTLAALLNRNGDLATTPIVLADGRFAATSVGSVGSTLDERDVAAMCRTLGLEPVPSPS